MKLLFSFFAFLFACSTFAEDSVVTAADQTFELDFPSLAPTLYTLATGEDQVPKLLYRLPDNFAAEKMFPVFVFLAGGNGGGMKGGGLNRAVGITGGNDYIAVTLPLFRRADALDQGELFGGLLIGVDDFPTVSKAYGRMLSGFFEAVPNAKKSGNFMGGFSNGAHTTGLLVSGGDETVLRHFQHFIFVDGGIWFSGLQRQRLKSCSFLGLYGDSGDSPTRPIIMRQFETMKMTADAWDRRFDLVVMEGVGHKFPSEYDDEILEWMKKR